MNIRRFDFGQFVMFVDSFTGNAGANFSHHHDDLLSYVIYDHGHEILVDPGMPSYLQPSEFPCSYRHNGIWCMNSMLRPLARFFTPRAFFENAIELNIESDTHSVHARAFNRYTGAERSLFIEGDEKGIRAHEIYQGCICSSRLGFTHCFADGVLHVYNPREISFAGLDFFYSHDVVVTPSYRAVAYGEPNRAHQISAQVVAGKFSWEMRRAA
jgi:hypothetical protein